MFLEYEYKASMATPGEGRGLRHGKTARSGRRRKELRIPPEPYWVDFWITRSQVEAQVVRGVLDASGIGTHLSPHPVAFGLLPIGSLRVQVPKDQFFAAKRVLREARFIGDRCYRFEVIEGGRA
jgi:hypothetical protein